MATVTTLGFAIYSTYSGRGVNQARRDLRRLDRTMDRVNKSDRDTSRGLSGLATAALAAAPALLTLAQQAAFVAGSLTAMAASAGAAGAAYGATMLFAAKRAMALDKAHAHLHKRQRKFVNAVHAMRSAWLKFMHGTGNKTLVPLTIAIKAITRNIHKLTPLINAMHPVIMKIARAFAHWMDSEHGFKRFINVIKKFGVPAFNHLQKAARHVLAFLGAGFRAFAPEGVKMAKVIERGARALHKWSNQGGWQRFIKSAKKNGPPVKAFFKALGPAIKQVLKAVVGLGPAVFSLATVFLKLIAATPVPVLKVLIVTLIALNTALKIAALIKAVSGAFMTLKGAVVALNFSLFASPWFWVAAAIAVVGAAIILLATKTKFFQTVWHGMVKVTKAVVHWISRFKFVLLALLGPVGAVAAGIIFLAKKTRFFQNVWKGLGKAVRFVWRNLIKPVWGALRAGWRFTAKFLRAGFRATGRAFRFYGKIIGKVVGGVKIAWKAMRVAGRFMWKHLVAQWKNLWKTFKFLGKVIGKVFMAGIRLTWKAMRAAGRFMGKVLSNSWQALRKAWRLLGSVIGKVFHAGIRLTWNAMKAAARFLKNLCVKLWGGMRAAWKLLGNLIHKVFFGPIKATFGAFRKGLHFLKATFDWAVDKIQKAWSRLKGIVAGPVRFFVNTVYDSGLKRAWNNTVGKIPGVPDLPGFRVKFARGGHVKGPGSGTADKIPAMLSNGEFVLRAAAVRQLGVPMLDKLNGTPGASKGVGATKSGVGHQAQRPIGGYKRFAAGGLATDDGGGGGSGFDIGSIVSGAIGAATKIAKTSSGILDSIGGFLSHIPLIGGAVQSAFSWASDLFTDVAKGAAHALLWPFEKMLMSGLHKMVGGGAWDKAIINALKGAIDAMIEYIFGMANDPVGGSVNDTKALKWAQKQEGKPYRLGAFGSSFDCSSFQSGIANIVAGHRPARAFTTFAFHGQKNGPLSFQKGLRAPNMVGVENRGIGHMAGTLLGRNTEATPPRVKVGGNARGAHDGLFNLHYGQRKSMGGPGNFGGHWRQLVSAILAELGLSQSNVGCVMRSIMQESGGNPNAVNGSDSNARAGTPSKGLNQVIQPTFNAYAGKYKKLGILNPYANVYASIRYARARYGGNWCARMGAPGGYADGGLVTVPTFDRGGWLKPGLNLVNNKTGHNELVTPGGGDVHVHIHGNVYTKNERQFNEMVIAAVHESKRKGRG